MKLTLPANEVTKAVQEYLRNTYSLYGEVTVQELHEVQVDILPRTIESMFAAKPDVEEATENKEDTEREIAINRADFLGVKYRADISTEKLIERIEEHEEEVLRLATEENQNFPEDDGNTLPLEDDVPTVTQSDEPQEEVSDETAQEEEAQPEKKKKSIFAKD